MINITTFTVKKDDGEGQTITIEPVLINLPDGKHFTGVYRLGKTVMTRLDLGEVAFHLHDAGQWAFLGNYFTYSEQEQIVEFILEREPLDSFVFTEVSDGIEHFYRVTDNEGHFGIEKDGILIAVIEHYEDWKQTEGEPLDDKLFYNIVLKIEGRND